jgi:hypothetical protein
MCRGKNCKHFPDKKTPSISVVSSTSPSNNSEESISTPRILTLRIPTTNIQDAERISKTSQTSELPTCPPPKLKIVSPVTSHDLVLPITPKILTLRLPNSISSEVTSKVPFNLIDEKKRQEKEDKINVVKEFFKTHNCILISKEYINCDELLLYVCSCGTIAEKCYKNFMACPRCCIGKCKFNTEKHGKVKEKEYKKAYDYFLMHECELLSDALEAGKDLEFRCSCEKIGKKRLDNFRAAPHCENCEGIDTIQSMINLYVHNGCQLLTKMTSTYRRKRHEFKCNCGKIDDKTLYMFELSPQCSDCDGYDYLSKIEEKYEEYGCELISKMALFNSNRTYRDKTLLKFRCFCGCIDSKTIQGFCTTPHCKSCTAEKWKTINANLRIPYNELKAFLKSIGYTLLLEEKDYKGVRVPFPSLCPQNHFVKKTRYKGLKDGGCCCKVCYVKSFEEMVKDLNNLGYEVLITKEEYKGVSKKFPGKCPQGHDIFIYYRAVMRGETCCMACGRRPYTFDEACLEAEEYGYKVIMDRKDYKGISRRMTGICKRGHPCNFNLTALKNGSTCCKSCGKISYQETSMKNYGTKFPMQNSEVFARQQQSCFSIKEYTFPSGKTTPYQGYENFCLDDLIHNNYKEEQIVNKVIEVPEIWYKFDKQRRYYPDIYIPHENRLIEIKSTWTFKNQKEKNFAKARAAKEQGYEIEIRVYSDKGKLIEVINF